MVANHAATVPPKGRQELFLQPVTSRNPFEEAVAQLVRAIRLGAVGIGEKFPPERELGEMLHVSRTTVREAIRGLEQAGYITTRRGRFGGTFVVREDVKLSSTDRARAVGPQLLEALDFRAAVEPGAAWLAAQRAEEHQIERMRTLADDMKSSRAMNFVRANCRFHILVAQGTNSAQLLKAVSATEMLVMDALLVVPKLDQSVEHSHDQHHAIVQAIEQGDSRAARDAMEEHLSGADLILRELVATRVRVANRR